MAAVQPDPASSPKLLALPTCHPSTWSLAGSSSPWGRFGEGPDAVEFIPCPKPAIRGHVADDSRRLRPENAQSNFSDRDVPYRTEHGIATGGTSRLDVAP